MSSQANTLAPIHEAMLIDGERVNGNRLIEVTNPARPSELVGTIVRGESEHVDAAVAAAKAAQRTWGSKTYTERATILDRALTTLEAGIDARAALFVRENGKVFEDARREVAGVVNRQHMALKYAAEIDAGRELKAPQGRTFVIYRPYGVVVSIVPWNSPISLGFTQIVAALLAGNCVVLKPPETCPLALIQTAAIFTGHLPHGALNIVTGVPMEIGDSLTTHPDVGKIGFTGSIASARNIMANAAQSIKDVTLELGGNDAAIILDDADFSDTAMKSMRGAVFSLAGQVCMAIKRIYVPTKRCDEFLEAFSNAVDGIVVGDGLVSGVTMGPLHTKRAQIRAQGLLDDAISHGAKATPLGKINDDATFADGHFMRPTIVTNVPDDAALMAEEQFCPVIPVTTYDDVDEVLQRANDTIYGLAGSIWSRNVMRAAEVARRMESGQVWINTHGTSATNHLAPYGGVKQSGIGRKSGLEGILEYAQSQTITTNEH